MTSGESHRLHRVVFMGTPAFAVPVLVSLLSGRYEIAGVYTQPDKPARRRQRLTAPPLKVFALERGLPLFQPTSFRRPEVREELTSLSPDLIVVAAYGKLLPADVVYAPALGALNVHPSLLPRYRGPSPVVAAILNGDDATGVTIMKLDEGMDTGPIVAQRETAIAPEESAEELTSRLFEMGASLLLEVLPRWAGGEIEARSQDECRAVITSRLTREDGRIDWRLPAENIARQVRAYHPWPGAFTHWHGRLMKIVQATAVRWPPEGKLPPGCVALLPARRAVIGTGDGALELRWLQLAGKRPVAAAEFVQGHPDFAGSTLT